MRFVTIDNEKVQKVYEERILTEATKGMRRDAQVLEDQVDDFIDKVEGVIGGIKDNPVLQKQLYQMLADMNKEQSEFIMAVKRICQVLDSGSKTIPNIQPEGGVQ
jgi:phage-related minor tail protein